MGFGDRDPVVIKGVKESTVAAKPGQELQTAISDLKSQGTEVSRATETTLKKESLEKTIQKKRDAIEELDGSPATKATGKVQFVLSFPIILPDDTTFETEDGVTFEVDDTGGFTSSELDRGPQTVPIKAVEAGAKGNVGPNQITDTSLTPVFLRGSVTNVDATTGGTDDTESEFKRRRGRLVDSIEGIQDAVDDIDKDLEPLRELGVIEEGEFTVQLFYDQPNISVSTSNRFVEHETVDGPIVRQKLGRGKVTINVDGVCTTPEAALLDNLVNEDQVRLVSNRFSGNTSIQGISTSPLEDGGAVNLDGNFTHEFGLELVEIE
jgi:hypothetical protein